MGVSSTCLAQISTSDIVIGGISYRCTMDYVKGIYGKPTKVKSFPVDGGRKSDGAKGISYYWGDTFYINTYNYKGNTSILSINTTANNGIATKAGIHVGMDKAVLLKTYGKPGFTYKHDGLTVYQYAPNGPQFLNFSLKNDKIVQISGGVDY